MHLGWSLGFLFGANAILSAIGYKNIFVQLSCLSGFYFLFGNLLTRSQLKEIDF